MSVAQLEQQKKDAREFVEHRELAARLMRNRDFQKLIAQEWMINEASRLVALSADPIILDPQMGDAAENDLKSLDDQIAEARLEEEQAQRDAEEEDSDERGELQ
jgi:hypothetical protein